MSKAILVIDMPDSCDMCDFVDDGESGKLWCGLPTFGYEVTDCIACRPDDCPLRPLPEKKEELNLNAILKVVESKEEIFDGIFLSYMIDGYNACIDEIGGGTNETDKETHQST